MPRVRIHPILFFCALTVLSFATRGQSGPGGVNTNLHLWFKADLGAESDGVGTAATDSDPVQIWQDQSGNNFDADQTTTAGSRPIFSSGLINGNPALVFDGTNDYFPISSLSYATSGALSDFTIYAILTTTNTGEGVILSYDRNEYFRFASDHNNDTGFGLSTTNTSAATDDFNATSAIEIDGVPHILGGSFNSATAGVNKFLYFDGTVNNSIDAGTLATGTGTTRFGFIGVGSEATTFDGPQGPTNYLEGGFAEMIYYERELTPAERQSVESYLALKYGITLSTDFDGDAVALETGGGVNEGDYVSSAGTPIWDADVNSSYHFSIAGVGRDDNSGLLQTTSQSVNSSAIFSLSETTFNDDDFVIWGNNNAGLSTSVSGSAFDRELDRVWKIQPNATNVSDIDQMTFDLSTVSVLPENLADFTLLVDTDEDFSDATPISPDSFSSDILTFNNVDLSGVTFFTLAFNFSSPAGIDANLSFWFKGDAGTEEAAGDDAEDGDQVRFWRDQSGNGFDGSQTTIADRPRLDATNTINFNPVLTFDGGTHFPISNLNYDLTTNTLNEISIFSVVKSNQATEGIIASYDRNSFYRFALNHNGTANFGLSTNVDGAPDATDDNNAANSGSDGFPHIVGGDYSTTTDVKNLYFDGSTDTQFTGAHGATGGILGNAGQIPRYGFIAANSEADDPSDGGNGDGIVGDIAEVIYYEGTLNATDLSKIQSYLAIKYGITLSTDYVASDGTTVVWDNSVNTGYNNLIAGIGLDNTATLNQLQSRSEADGSILTGSDAGLLDGEYIVWGSDNADLSIVAGAIGTQNGRFNRLWKYQTTGATTNIDQVLVDISTVIIKPDDVANYSLILDDADDFSTIVREVSPTLFSNGVLQFDNVDLSGASFIALAVTEDLDNDGIADATDIDDDNDGILDADEGDGLVDTDGDGIVDSRDLDSDNDGIGDLYESGAEGAGTALATLDANGDGIIDVGNEGANGFDDRLETAVDNGVLAYTISNYETVIDAGGIAGPPDFRDIDTDNNGISDLVESGRSTSIDSDDNGVFEGTDTDQDGIPDEIDAEPNAFGSTELIPSNQDGTGEPDFRDIDNDGDLVNDIDEVGLTDVDGDGMLDGSTDADGDGVLAERDDDEGAFAQMNNADLLTGAGTDWYSYRSGVWTDPDNWTTDPSGTTRVNPGGLIPNNFVDNVTVLNGDEMTLNFNGLVVSSLAVEEGGIVNIGTTINHNFNVISGAGSISLATDEFPGGTLTDFISTSGGTVIYTDQSPAADYELTVDRTFNNVIFSSASNTITLKADLTLNGDLTVESGTLEINDNTSDSYTDNTIPLDILISGNLAVEAAGSITVGDVDASTQISSSGIFNFHEIELLGDMTNDGTISFTNLSPTSIADGRYRDKYPTAGDSDNDDIPASEFGVVEVLFTNGLADQLITLNGPTDFYRIEVAKGTSQTFIAEFNASATANFRLLGRIAMSQSDDSGDTPDIDNHRALGLEAGILKLGTNIVINQIAKNDNASTQGGNRNYIIDQDAQLWLSENSIVTKSNDWGIHPFGRLKISDNAILTFAGGGQRTILVDNQGVFEMTGGTVDITQFRNKTGADGAPRGSFIMTGGTLNVGDGGADGSHGIFSVPWEEQNFVLSASDEANPPTINIILDGNRGKDDTAIQIGVAEGNFDVGVSNINVIHTSTTDYKVISTAPLYNFSYDGSSTSELIIDNIPDSNGDDPGAGGILPDDNSGTTPSPAQFAQGLTITNDFTISDGRFDANDFDITVGNIMTIETGGEYDPGANTTLFNGTSPVQRVILNGVDPLLGGFNNLSFTGAGTAKEFGGDLATVNVLEDLSIGSGVTLNDVGKAVIVNGNITNSGTHETDYLSPGRIELSGGATQHTIGGDGNGRFEILTLDDALGATFDANQQVDSVLNLVNGVLDINTNQLTINSTATDPIIDDNSGDGATNNFGATRMIQAAGNSSDGGLNYFIDQSEMILFPIGTSGKYTPAELDINVINSNTGFVNLILSDNDLATTETTGGDLLNYFWRLNTSDFGSSDLPTINSLQFTYDETDVGSDVEANYIAGFVLNQVPFTRDTDTDPAGGVNTTNNTITFTEGGTGASPFDLISADFTAGEAARFVGSPQVFYSRTNSGSWTNWNVGSNWSLDQVNTHTGAAAGDFPQDGDIAVIGSEYTGGGTGRHQFTLNVDGIQLAELIFDSQPDATALIVTDMSRVRVIGGVTLDAGRISGRGELAQYIGTPVQTGTIVGDLGDFIEDQNNGWFFWFQSAIDVTITDRFTYPIFRAFGAGGTLDFSQDVNAFGLVVDNETTMSISTNWTLDSLVQIGSNGAGTIEFPNVGSNVTLETFNLFYDNTNAGNNISVENAGTDVHRLRVNGDIDLGQGTGFNLTSAAGAQVELELSGEGDHSFTNATGTTAELYRLIVNKGSSQANTFTFNDDFNLNSTSSGATKALELQNGTLVLNDNGIDIDLNGGGGNFTIPATAGLTVQDGTVRTTATGVGSGNGVRLNGKLTVSGGDVILDGGPTADNFVEYGTGGAAEIEISSGNLVVGTQLRRNILSGDGVINYTQTGGTALFGANAGPEDSRGVFEIVNTGAAGTSSFNLSGASTVFAIVHGQAAPTEGTFIIGDDVSVNVASDAVIDFGYNNTPIATTYSNDLNETYEITTSASLPNVRIDNDNNNSPIVELIQQPLTVSDNLQILNGGSLIANGFNLTVNDGFTNDGTYTPGSNTTTFNGDVQTISGITSTIFNNLVINPTTSLTLANTITVNGDMDVLTGTFNDNGNRVTLSGDLNATVDLTSDGSGNGGIDMTGTATQNLSLPDGAATIDKLIVNNPNGINQLDNGGVATFLTINDELALDNGLWNLGDNRLIFDPDALATSTTGFDETKMISVNGVKRSDGVERQFLSANGDVAAFELPIGTPDKYTPVVLDVDGTNDDGSLLVKPINSVHPSADATLTGPTDELDALNYYWLVTTDPSSVTGFSGSVSFQYLESDANNPGQNESTWENNAARLLAPNWFKPSGNLVNITANVMTFSNSDLSSFGGTSFDGEFTIGNDIPDELAQYRSNNTGLWNTSGNWDIENDGDGMFDDGNGVPQPGTVVIVNTGDEITMSSATDNDQNVFSLQIDGTLDVADTDGHNFGDISGTGTLRISNPTLPGGNYDNFFLTTGGTLDLAGASGYTISPDFASGVRGLTVSGGGTKVLPSIAINVGDGGINVLGTATLNNSTNNNDIVTSGDVTINTTGSLNLGNASASLTAVSFNLNAGTFTSTGAPVDLSGDINLNGGTFNAGNATHTLGGNFNFNTAATFSNGSGQITFDGAGNQSITTNAAATLDFSNLRVDKPSGTMTIGTNVSALINGALGLLNGNVINTLASGSQLRLVGSATYASSPDGYIDGPLFKDLANTATPFEFRIGKGSIYKPITVNPDDASYTGDITWEAEYYPSSATTFSSGENSIENLTAIETNAVPDQQVVEVIPSEFWRLDDGGGAGDLDAISLSVSSFNSGISQDDINDQLLQVMVWDEVTNGGQWNHLGGTSTGTPSSASIVSDVDLSFTERIVTIGAESNSVLPVELVAFLGEIMDNTTKLVWESASEINNDYFDVQHSLDGESFETIGQVDGSGNSNELETYRFTHKSPAFGENYYRLRQVDFDGKSEIHETLRLTNDFVRRGIESIIYPNPGISTNLKLRLSSGDNHTPVSVRIVDLTGQVYFQRVFDGSLSIDEKLEVGSKITSGIYFVEITQGDNLQRQKLVLK